MSFNPTFGALPASVTLLDDSNTTAISYTAPFTTTSNNTCYGGTCTSFQDANGALQFRFTGTNVWVFGKTGGLVRVFVDDQFIKTIDATLADYSSFPRDSLKQPALWASSNLDGGTHTLKLAGVPGKDLNLLIDFFAINGTVTAPSTNPSPAETRRLTGIIVGTLFAFFAVVAILGFLCFFISRQRKRRLLNLNKQSPEKGPVSSADSAKETTTTMRGGSGRWSFFNLGLSKLLERKRNTFPLITIVRQPPSPPYYDTTRSYPTSNSTLRAQDAPYAIQHPYAIDQALLQPEAMSPPATFGTSTEDPFQTHQYIVPTAQVPTSIASPNGGVFVGGFSSQARPKAPYEPPVSASSGSSYSMPAFGEPIGGSRVQPNNRYPPLDVQMDLGNADVGRVSEEINEATPLVEKPPTYPYPRSTERASPIVPSNEKSASSGLNRNTSARRRAVDDEEGGYATYGVSSFSPATPTPAYTSWSHGASNSTPLNNRATFTPTPVLTSTPSQGQTENQSSRARPPPASDQTIPVVSVSAPLGSSKAVYAKQPSLWEEERPPSFDAHADFDTQNTRPRVSLPQPPPPPGPNVQSFRVPASPSASLRRGVPASPVSPALSSSSGHHGSVRGPRPHRTSTIAVTENEGASGSVSSAVPSRAKQEDGRQVKEVSSETRGKEGGRRGRRGGSDPESPLDPAVVFMWR